MKCDVCGREISPEKVEVEGRTFSNCVWVDLGDGEKTYCGECYEKMTGHTIQEFFESLIAEDEAYEEYGEEEEEEDKEEEYAQMADAVLAQLKQMGLTFDGKTIRVGWRKIGTYNDLYTFVRTHSLEDEQTLAQKFVKERGGGAPA